MPNMRVTQAAHDKIRAIARDRQVSMQDALDIALQSAEEAEFWRQTQEAFADAEFVREYREELQDLDNYNSALPEYAALPNRPRANQRKSKVSR